MASEAQIAANRRNALKSTGPKTAEGKARVAQNGLKHGLYARQTLMPGEDPAEFQALVEDLKARWRPADDVELGLLLQYADAMWRLSRIAAIEAGLLADGLPGADDPAPDAVHPESWGLGKAFIARGKEIARLSLHESRLSRLRERARKELEALQAARRQAAAALALDSQTPEAAAPAPARSGEEPSRDAPPAPAWSRPPAAAALSRALPPIGKVPAQQEAGPELALLSRRAA